MQLFDLSGRVAVVTGGNGGIGLGMAKGLAQAGASIVVAGRDQAKSAAAVAELAGLGAEGLAVTVDVADEASCQAMVQAAKNRFGRLDILINNAGTNIRKQPEEYTLAEWHHILETNLSSAFMCSQAAYPAMQAAGGGKIVMIGSMMSIFGASFTAPYAATKGGIVQLAKALACAWAKDNIQVNAVLPGWIDTALTVRGRRDIPGLEDRVVARTPAGRWGVPDDFSGIAAFLCSPASDFVTGAEITVDGGYSVQG
jgi:2-deoxy-D-gluconate 3-dehydrogenase